MTDFNLVPLLPEIFIAITAMGLLVVGAFNGNKITQTICYGAVICFVIAVLLIVGLKDFDVGSKVLNNMFAYDSFSGFLKILILVGMALSVLISVKYLEQEQLLRFEVPVLFMLAGLGMMIMVSANNMLSLYMGLELQSLSLYVLAAIRRNSLKSSEAGIKYFILGALSSGMLLFGISLIYGFTGSLDFDVIGAHLAAQETMGLGALIGMVFVLSALAFKISAAPFHMWTPDVYQGAPTNVTALFAMVPKIAAIGLIIRLLFEPFAAVQGDWTQILYVLSLASMTVGAFAGIAQNNIKRLLAYSSIGHMGYVLVGIVAGTEQGIASVLIYLSLYMIMSAGTFAIVMTMRRNNLAVSGIEDLAGLSRSNPKMAYLMALFMLSMAGIPPLAGFFAKLVVFQAAVSAGFLVLAVLGVLTSVVAAYYYLRVIKVMFFDDAVDEFDKTPSLSRDVVLVFAALVTVFYILAPSALINSASQVTAVLF